MPGTTLQTKPKVDNVRKEMTKVIGMEMPSMPSTNTDPILRTKKNPKIKIPTVVDTQDTTYTTTTEQTNCDDEMRLNCKIYAFLYKPESCVQPAAQSFTILFYKLAKVYMSN